MQTEKVRQLSLFPLVALFLTLIVVFHLGGALLGKSLYRPIHLGTALEYSKGHIDLLRPVIVGFNATETPTAQELPLWQATTGLVFKVTNSQWFGWANLVSLIFFATGLWPFFRLARRYLDERTAWWALAFFLAQPIIVIMAGEASTDGFCLVLAVWFLFFADNMIRTGKFAWWLPTVLFAVSCAISKLPFFMTVGLCSIFILIAHSARSARAWTMLASTGLIAAGIFAVWTHYCDSLSAQALYPYQELRLSKNPEMVFWYFGDLHQLLSVGPWLKGGWRFLHATLGALPLVALLAIALLKPGNRMPKLWLAAALATTLVFTNLVLIHWHYYLMWCPAVALLCGSTLARWEQLWAQELPNPWLRIVISGMVLGLSAVEGIVATKISIYYDSYPKDMAAIIREHTKPEDKLVLYGGDWGGEELFRSKRKGFYVFHLHNTKAESGTLGLYELLQSDADLQRLKSMGYTKLVLMSESPVRFAAVAINPGSKRKRMFYPTNISANVNSWPVVFQSEDILIKEIQ